MKFDTFSKIDSEEKAYFLGFMYADGSVYYSEKSYSYASKLKLAKKDRDILFQLNKLFPIFSIHEYEDDIVLRSYNRELAINLINWGVLRDKSYSNKLNLKLPNINKELRNHFVRGFWDGDGCIYQRSINGLDICVVNTSKPFLDSLCKYLNNQKIECKVNGYSGINKNLYRLRITKQQSCMIFKDLIYNNSKIHLKRKYDKIMNFNPQSITEIKREAALRSIRNPVQVKSDELLETLITQDKYDRIISSQATSTLVEGSETT